MAKITQSRSFDTAESFQTQAGQQLRGMITAFAELVELVLRNLRNGLTYADNFDSLTKQVSLRDGVATVIEVGAKRPTEARVRFVLDPTRALKYPLAYSFNPQGQFTVTATFITPPVDPPLEVPLILLILFG